MPDKKERPDTAAGETLREFEEAETRVAGEEAPGEDAEAADALSPDREAQEESAHRGDRPAGREGGHRG